MNNRRIIALTLALATFQVSAAVRGDKAEYLGGTAPNISKGSQGQLVANRNHLSFRSGADEFTLPYHRIESIEFGQKVGRRVGATIALGVTTLGVLAAPMLLSKKKKHYLTITYRTGPDARGTAVFELAKDTVRTTLANLQARTGKRVEYQEGAGI